MNAPTVPRITQPRLARDFVNTLRKRAAIGVSCSWWTEPAGCSLSTATPMYGVNSTATIQETSKAIATTANIVKQYSPALLFAKPTGRKPATDTSVPVSIGNAVEV
jgi:hypothetical protein